MRTLPLGIAAALMATGFAAPAMAQVAQWRISEVSGQVRIVESGRARLATRGALLASGATIATAPNGRAVLVRGREYVVVSPRSQLRIPEQAQSRGGIVQMLTDWGTALFRIERRETPHFGVQTPYLAAVVKGTTFTVTVGQSGASVQVTEGAVEVSTVDGGAAELVRPGMIASVGASDLYQLNIDGDTSRHIRSSGVAAEGVVTVPVPAQGAYSGPTTEDSAVDTPVTEDPVAVEEATDGLVEEVSEMPALAARDLDRAERANSQGDGNGGGTGNSDNGGAGSNDGGGSGSGGSAGDDGNAGGNGNGNGGSAGDNEGSGDAGGGGNGNGGSAGDNGGSGSGGGSDKRGSCNNNG
jgi:hypothetical protein